MSNFMIPGRTSKYSKKVIHSSRGFTLLEVLLTMAILAVIMTVIYISFSSAGRDVKQAETLRDETDLARTLLTRISVDISNAYMKSTNVPVIFSGTKEELTGESVNADKNIRHDRIDLTTLSNWPKPDSKETELWEVGYFFKEKPEGKGYALFRREKRELSNDVPALEGGDEYEITDRVASLQFTYSDDGKTWTDNGWDRTLKNPPKAVEIALTFESGKGYVTRVDIGNRQ